MRTLRGVFLGMPIGASLPSMSMLFIMCALQNRWCLCFVIATFNSLPAVDFSRCLYKARNSAKEKRVDILDASEGSFFYGCDCIHVTASSQFGCVATVSCSQSAASLQTTSSNLQRSC